MAKRFRDAPDEEIPVGVPDRRPKAGAKCDVCTTVGPKATLQFCMKRTGRPPGKIVGNAPEVCALMKPLADSDRESFWALHLDVRNRIVDMDKVAVGNMTGVEVHPTEVFRGAMLTGAQNVILVHNHPSGDPTPSRQDQELTKRFKEIGDLLGIRVLDHIVVGNMGCISLASHGFLGEGKDVTYPTLASRPSKRKR